MDGSNVFETIAQMNNQMNVKYANGNMGKKKKYMYGYICHQGEPYPKLLNWI